MVDGDLADAAWDAAAATENFADIAQPLYPSYRLPREYESSVKVRRADFVEKCSCRHVVMGVAESALHSRRYSEEARFVCPDLSHCARFCIEFERHSARLGINFNKK